MRRIMRITACVLAVIVAAGGLTTGRLQPTAYAAESGETTFRWLESFRRTISALLRVFRVIFGQKEAPVTYAGLIQDVSTEKARYAPGERVTVRVRLSSYDDGDSLMLRVTHLGKSVFEKRVSVAGNETAVELPLPMTDFTGYAIEAALERGGRIIDKFSGAVEVASAWSRYPRYGYLTRYTADAARRVDDTLDRLARHHITGLFYYDVMDRHDQPLAGSVSAPARKWQTLARQDASFDTVRALIDGGHARSMDSFLYNLIYGAYQDYASRGIDPAWGLYRDAHAQQQDYHGELPGGWETQRIYLFNPLDARWQASYLAAMGDALKVFGYDGVQIDSLGNRGDVYASDGKRIDLANAFAPLLNRLHRELGARVIFNPVSGFGADETLKNAALDIVYEEVWPWDCPGYADLYTRAVSLLGKAGNRGIVIAAYMDKEKTAGAFGEAGVRLTDAVLMAAGAAHLELGDTGMLKSEYYPGASLEIGASLEKALRSGSDFFTAYENVLRNSAFVPSARKTSVGLKNINKARAGDVWCAVRERENGDLVMNFINFTGVSNLGWDDPDGTQTAPQTQTNLRVTQRVSYVPRRLWMASPDRTDGPAELPFTAGVDLGGRYITFTLPSLEYMNMVVAEM